MKKYISLLLLLSCLFASSCQKEAGIDDGYDRFTAYQEGSSTKTVLGDDLTPMWNPGEQISIYDGNNNAFAAELTAPAASAVFKGKLTDKKRKNYLAASPYSADYTFMFLTKAVYNMMLPTEQTAVKGSYDPKALLSVAYSTDKNFNFKNLCSLVKFTVGSDGVTSVEIESRDETPLSGRLDAICDEGTVPELSLYSSEVYPSVVLKGDFEKGATYYVTTLPAVLESGFTVTMNGDVVTRKETMPVSFARSGMINLGTISLDPKENVLPGQDGSDDGNQGGNDGGDDSGDQGGNAGGNTGGNTGGNDGGNTGGDQGGNDDGDDNQGGNDGGNTGGDQGGSANILYFNPGDSWKSDGARFEAYFMNGVYDVWAIMTDADQDGIYECTIPEGYTKVIFVRMNPGGQVNYWDSKWNQTVDLEISGNLFTITDPWPDGGNAVGTWSTK